MVTDFSVFDIRWNILFSPELLDLIMIINAHFKLNLFQLFISFMIKTIMNYSCFFFSNIWVVHLKKFLIKNNSVKTKFFLRPWKIYMKFRYKSNFGFKFLGEFAGFMTFNSSLFNFDLIGLWRAIAYLIKLSEFSSILLYFRIYTGTLYGNLMMEFIETPVKIL